MKTTKQFTPLQESLLFLTSLDNQLGIALKVLIPEEHIKNEDLKFTVCNHIQILLCSFLDEWIRLEHLGGDKEIQATLKIASPALDRIRGWKGLHKVRSKLLAHGGRERKNGDPAWIWDVFEKYNAPTNYAETIFLGKCALRAGSVAHRRHQKEYEKAKQEIMLQRKPIEDKGIRTISEVKKELEKLGEEMAQIEKSLSEHS